MNDQPRSDAEELARKLVHIGFGFCALLLRWLTWREAMLVAVAALAFNRFVLPAVGGRRISRHDRGYDLGILIYPAAVLALILSFPAHREMAGAVWAILAFGDGTATLAGRFVGGPRLPWHRRKSWAGSAAFLIAGFAAAFAIYGFLATGGTALPAIAVVGLTVLACAAVESLPLAVDDNFTVPLVGALTMAALTSAERWPVAATGTTEAAWLAANAALAIAGYAAKSVDVSGLIGGMTLGAVILLFGGWQLYVVLLLFFVTGTALTRLGYGRKAERGLAQERGGRRGFGHAFSNVGVAALCALAGSMHPRLAGIFWLAGAASLATAAADTAASEIGQWIGRRAFLPLSLRRVEPGTEGAISWEGTGGGLTAGAVVAATAAGLYGLRYGVAAPVRIFFVLTLAAFAGSYLESIAGHWNRTRAAGVPNGALNFFNTATGAAIAAGLLIILASLD